MTSDTHCVFGDIVCTVRTIDLQGELIALCSAPPVHTTAVREQGLIANRTVTADRKTDSVNVFLPEHFVRHSASGAVTACSFRFSVTRPSPTDQVLEGSKLCNTPIRRLRNPNHFLYSVHPFLDNLGMKSPTSTDSLTMAPSTLDLFILTFNCAKNLIDASVFASHLQGALSQNATGLPDVVVL